MITEELWAVLDDQGMVMMTLGGSSTAKKLMVYPSEQKAITGMELRARRAFTPRHTMRVKCVYRREDNVI